MFAASRDIWADMLPCEWMLTYVCMPPCRAQRCVLLLCNVSAMLEVWPAIVGLAMFQDSKEAQAVPPLAKPITGHFLLVPLTVVEETVPAPYKSLYKAWEENRNVEGSLNTTALEGILTALNVTDYNSLWFSPVSELVKREPINKIPVYMEHCAFDPMRDDVIIYQKVLESRGIPTKTQFFSEDAHWSWAVGNRPSNAKNPTFEEAQMAGMKWLLSKQ